MAQYYRLVAGLPDLLVDAPRVPQTQEEFYLELLDELSKKDRELLEWLCLDQFNRELVVALSREQIKPLGEDEEETEQEGDDESLLPLSELRRLATLAHQGASVRRSELVPGYALYFLNQYFAPREEGRETPEGQDMDVLSLEDSLSAQYYMAGMRSKNAFLAEWFRFNYILKNLLVIYTCRKLGWTPADYVVGSNDITDRLLTSKAKDFDLSEDCPWVGQMIQIAEETDITRRERAIDVLRWRFLDEVTFARVFEIDNVLAYYLRLGIIERWQRLDAETGEEVFRQIVMGLKAESNASLQDFRERTSKR